MKTKYLIYLVLLSSLLSSCGKYLSVKPDKKMVVPSTVQELQGILDYYPFMNILCTAATETSSDNYYLTDEKFQALRNDQGRFAYLWEPGMFINASDWQNEYTVVYNANLVLEGLANIPRTESNQNAWDYCKGSALVFRAKSFYEIAQVWTLAYDSSKAGAELGIPLRLTSDFNVPSKRSTLKETYDQIISDLKDAISLLPATPPVHPYRPSKVAAYGLLARTYLTMQDYTEAKLYADSCLQLNNILLNYNNVNAGSVYTFLSYQFTNPEDMMHSSCTYGVGLTIFRGNIDTILYNSYDSDDLRKSFYFGLRGDGSYYFKGSYDGGSYYNGIATDEVYLIRAECLARQGNVSAALEDLNTLLENRWKTGTFIPLTADNPADALKLVLTERRKELVYRMLRFTDIKRLNQEGANISIERVINGQAYILKPNDPRSALPIPMNVIKITGMKQN